MIKKVRIAVDHGNRNMKTCSQVFTTGLTIQDKKPARGEKFLFYEGKYYVLSENRIPYQRDKTQDDRFFILTLFAIVKELEENPQIQPEDVIQVDLPIGLPPKHYAELCERYEAYFKRQGKIHDINYCGSTYHITIGEVMAFPQDYAAMMTMIEKLQQIPKVVGIDIGGFTTDYLLMRKGNPDGKKGKVELQSMKEEWEEKYKKTFRERKVKDILSALLFAMVYGVLLVGALSPAQNIINDIASGIGMGMATVVVAFVGLVEVKNRLTKRRNKREDADQEKSDTE